MNAENSAPPPGSRFGRNVNAGMGANAAGLAPAVAGMAWRVIVVIGTALDRLFTAHERWRQRQALLGLDDHLLKDIGLTRVDVEREAAKHPWEN